tara:strand:- start:1088 stop:1789 length:702 start_codon:yes stop_codon:yes gene_type:complete
VKLFNSIKKEDQKIIKAILFLFGFEPVNINLYKLALLHKSKNKNESNERLEYLGDAVLNLIVAEYLFKKYPYKDEGFLTKIRSKIVSRESLNDLGRKVGLKELINFKNVNEYSKNYNSIYGDALEAIIGAVYLDVGFEYCQEYIVKNIVIPYYNFDELVNKTHNFKSKILEWSQKEKKLIKFSTKKIILKNNSSQFESILIIENKEISKGFGSNKKSAEKDASRLACEKLELK